MGDVKFRLLITGAGAPGFAGIYTCLKKDKELEIYCCDAKEDASGRALCKKFFTVPKATDEYFAETLLNQCKKHNIGFILPIVTAELQVLAGKQELFLANGIKIIMNPEQALLTANNKCLLYEKLKNNQIHAPSFQLISNIDELFESAKQLGHPEKDIIVKPCISNGSRGFRILSERNNNFNNFFQQKPGAMTMRLSELYDLLKDQPIPPLLLSEYLPGPEYSVDMICDHGKTHLCIPRRRSRINNGISVEGKIEKHDEIISYCTDIAQALHLHAFNGIQVKENRNGRYSILEINPRLQGTTSAILLAGVNIPQIGIDYFVKGMPFHDAWKQEIHWGTSFFRVYKDLKKD